MVILFVQIASWNRFNVLCLSNKKMNTTKRIEYIDALRGFTMILVVSVHIYSLCFMQGNAKEYELSYNNFFGLFRMPLFFFISGFVFYKFDRYWDRFTLKKFIISKIRVQLFSTFIFLALFCLLFQKEIKPALLDNQKLGYWFTYILFVYYVLYIGIDKTICWFCRKPTFSNSTIIISLGIGLFLYYSINNGFLLNLLSPHMTTLLSISKWQYFFFFSFGCVIHKNYASFLAFQNNKYVKDAVLLSFVCVSTSIFYQNNTKIFIFNNYLLVLLAAILGILLALFLFKANEIRLSSSTKVGYCLQYIGKHTLDIYFLHYFFLPYNMSYVGIWLNEHFNPILEFCFSLALALVVIVFSLFISNIIRLSPTITYFLLGGKSIHKK